jgi:quinol monooxygenase YgiN
MLIVQVHVRVKPETIDDFIRLTLKNARASLLEPGIARFDVIQDATDPTRFQLVEVYRSELAPGEHKQTAHYAEWRDGVADMMAEPRTSNRYVNLFPSEGGWDVPAGAR